MTTGKPVRRGAPRHVARRDLGPLVVVRRQRMRTVGRRQREKRRGVDERGELMRARRGEHRLQPADVDRVELRRIAAPQRDQRGGVADRVHAGGRRGHRARVADVAIDGAAGQPRGRRAAREDDRLVPGARERAHDRRAEVAGAAGDQHSHALTTSKIRNPKLPDHQFHIDLIADVSAENRLGGVRVLRIARRRQRRPVLHLRPPQSRAVGLRPGAAALRQRPRLRLAGRLRLRRPLRAVAAADGARAAATCLAARCSRSWARARSR